MIKRFLAILLMICLLIPCAALAAEDKDDVPAPVTVRDSSGQRFSAEIVALGYMYSQVRVGAAFLTVPTEDLSWDTNAQAGKRVAWIHAPNKGSISLRKTEKPKSRIMDHADTNLMVRVVSVGKKTTGIVFGEHIRFIANSGLTYPSKLTAIKMGTVSYNGETDGLRSVAVYLKGSTSARKVAEVPTGSIATVYSQKKSWSEVDVAGWHGFIKTEYLELIDEPMPTTVEAGLITAAPARTETASGGDAEDEGDYDDDLDYDGEYDPGERTEIDQSLIDEDDWDDEEVDTRGYY